MSASSKKKLRKEQMAARLTEKQLAEKKETKSLKIYTTVFVAVVAVILVVALVLAAFSLVSSSGILPRNVEAVTIGSHTLTNAQLNYFYVDAIQDQYNQWSETYGDYIDLGLAYSGLTVGKPLNEQPYPLAADQTWADYFVDMAIQDATGAYALYDAAVAANHTMSENTKSTMDMMLQMLGYYAAAGGYSNSEEYLKATYGNGATMDSYKQYMEVTALGSDYASARYDALTYTQEEIDSHSKENYNDFSSYSYSQFYVDRDDFVLCTDPNNTAHLHTADEYAPALAEAKKVADALAASGAATVEDLDKEVDQLDAYKDSSKNCQTYKNKLLLELKESTQKVITDWLTSGKHKAGDMAVLPIKATADKSSEELDGYMVVMFHQVNENNAELVDVRHILVEFESEDKKAEAKEKIEAIRDQWMADGGTEDAFKALVAENTADTGSKDNGGLYEDVYPGQMVEAFNDWCFDETRKTGDSDIVETEYGYHLMYFVGKTGTTYRNTMVENFLRNEEYNEQIASIVEKVTAQVHNTKYLDLDMALTPNT